MINFLQNIGKYLRANSYSNEIITISQKNHFELFEMIRRMLVDTEIFNHNISEISKRDQNTIEFYSIGRIEIEGQMYPMKVQLIIQDNGKGLRFGVKDIDSCLCRYLIPYDIDQILDSSQTELISAITIQYCNVMSSLYESFRLKTLDWKKIPPFAQELLDRVNNFYSTYIEINVQNIIKKKEQDWGSFDSIMDQFKQEKDWVLQKIDSYNKL